MARTEINTHKDTKTRRAPRLNRHLEKLFLVIFIENYENVVTCAFVNA